MTHQRERKEINTMLHDLMTSWKGSYDDPSTNLLTNYDNTIHRLLRCETKPDYIDYESHLDATKRLAADLRAACEKVAELFGPDVCLDKAIQEIRECFDIHQKSKQGHPTQWRPPRKSEPSYSSRPMGFGYRIVTTVQILRDPEEETDTDWLVKCNEIKAKWFLKVSAAEKQVGSTAIVRIKEIMDKQFEPTHTFEQAVRHAAATRAVAEGAAILELWYAEACGGGGGGAKAARRHIEQLRVVANTCESLLKHIVKD